MIYILIFIISFFSTFLFREIAKNRSFMDHPNSRSSHTTATPTGGGVAIVISFLIGDYYLYHNSMIRSDLFYATLSGSILAIVSFIDDVKELSPKIRLAAQLAQ